MREERIELSQQERDRLKVLHQVREGHLKQVEASVRLGLSPRQVRRILTAGGGRGRGIVHGLRGRPSNRKIPAAVQGRVLAAVQRRYADFGPTLGGRETGRARAEGESANVAPMDEPGGAMGATTAAREGGPCMAEAGSDAFRPGHEAGLGGQTFYRAGFYQGLDTPR